MDERVNKESRKESFRTVLLALMEDRDLSQRKIAEKIGSKPANFNKRVIAGSMRPDMIMKINEIFGVDLLDMVLRYESGEGIKNIVSDTSYGNNKTSVEFELTPEEVKQVILNQQKSQEELQEQFNQLVGQIKTWIDHDQERMRKQENLINLLLEEREEYKSKKK